VATTATSAEFSRIINTTLRNYLRIEEDGVIRRRLLLAMLKSKGRILYKQGGDGFQWQVRFRRAKMQTNNGMQVLSFQAENRWQRAFLDYQGYAITDAMPKREQLKNQSAAALIQVYKRLLPLLMEDLEDQFSEEIYVDSNAAGNSYRMSGLETMFETNGTVNITTGGQRTANSADVVGYPNSTYANLSTSLGAFGGAWGESVAQTTIATTWPSGRGDPEYDFWSPVIVNYTSSAFGQTTWWSFSSAVGNAKTATRFGIRKMKRNSKDTIPLVMMDDMLYNEYLESLDSQQRIIVTDQQTRAKQFGFMDSIYQDGAEITSEYGIPSGVGYGIDLESCQLMSMQGQLFEGEGPEYDMSTRSSRVAVDCLGQFKFKSPRAFFKLVSLA
jgi:hypothetical protein